MKAKQVGRNKIVIVNIISFISGLRIFNELYVICVSILHPDVQFIKYTTIRTLLDTHRNQGILSVLLCIRGEAQPDVVKRHLLVRIFLFLF